MRQRAPIRKTNYQNEISEIQKGEKKKGLATANMKIKRGKIVGKKEVAVVKQCFLNPFKYDNGIILYLLSEENLYHNFESNKFTLKTPPFKKVVWEHMSESDMINCFPNNKETCQKIIETARIK